MRNIARHGFNAGFDYRLDGSLKGLNLNNTGLKPGDRKANKKTSAKKQY